MNQTEQIDLLEQNMMRFNKGDAKRIQHLMKVHRFAQLIGHMEKLDAHTQFITECAALVHDIGIRPAEKQYGACDGKLQEKVGPAYAREMLEEMQFEKQTLNAFATWSRTTTPIKILTGSIIKSSSKRTFW